MSKNRSKSRAKNNPLTRRQGTKQPRQRILIVTEGDTEKTYFDAVKQQWRLHNVVVVENPDCTDPVSLLNYAKEKDSAESIFDGGYDAVWLVYDLEKPNAKDRRDQSQKVKDKITGKKYNEKFHLAISDPSFEFWYVLHFDKTTKDFTGADEVVKHLKKHLIGYKKGIMSEKEFESILTKTQTAIANAQWVRERLLASDSAAPITYVDKLWTHPNQKDSLATMCFKEKEEK